MANIDERLLSSSTEAEINENFNRVLTIMDVDSADLEALYALAKVFVVFDSDGGSAVDSQLIPYGSKATEPDDPTKTDYTFVGWFIGEDEFDFETEIKADTTLTAVWEADGE